MLFVFCSCEDMYFIESQMLIVNAFEDYNFQAQVYHYASWKTAS